MQRIRIFYQKGPELQYTGNLDMHKVWERTFRRAKLPLAYSQGFHPQPKIQQAAPLPLGFTSNAEIVDIWLDTDDALDVITRKLTDTTQPGLTIHKVQSIELFSEALPNLVHATTYLVEFDDLPGVEFTDKLAALLAKPTIERERRGKKYDLRPLVERLEVAKTDPFTLSMQLTSLPSATGRPEEVLEELGIDPFSVDIDRTGILLK
ncbi:MAG: TIGR03936 family radical SAM-associated protein [Anaerolineaceae bacterium]|nr:TIGR03936 family radical SAM-associated protein [Anaerolineaceae bacterium]